MFVPEMKIVKFEVEDVITVSGGSVDINCPEDFDNWQWEPPCVAV